MIEVKVVVARRSIVIEEIQLVCIKRICTSQSLEQTVFSF